MENKKELKIKIEELLIKVQSTEGTLNGTDWYGWKDLTQFIKMNYCYIAEYIFGFYDEDNIKIIKGILEE